MTFVWPQLLWLLLLVPLLVLVQMLLGWARRRRGDALGGLARMHTGGGSRTRLRRWLPPLLLLVALAGMLLAVARPTARLSLPSANEVVVLAIDVSGSMTADDLEPSRLAAAQEAAREFVATLPASSRVSIVSFASSASILLPPTRDRADIDSAISRLQVQPGTAVGSAILIGLKALFPDLEIDMRSSTPKLLGPDEAGSDAPGDGPRDGSIAGGTAPEPGEADWAAIVLLTDGEANAGSDPVESARIAASLGVRVYPVGIGTPEGMVLNRDGWSMRVRLDESTLREIADVTAGDYYFADDSLDLRRVYNALGTRLSVETREFEITGLVSAAALLVLLLSAGLSLRWSNRVI